MITPFWGPQSRDTSWTRIKWHHCQGPLRGHESAETPIGNESIWLNKLLVDLGHEQSSPTELYRDNNSAIAIAQNLVQHGRAKHINVKFHSIREAEKNSLVKLHYCSTDVQHADIMTKAFPKSRLEFLRLKLGMSKANLKEEC